MCRCYPIIKYIPLQQGLRLILPVPCFFCIIIKYIPLQQGLRLRRRTNERKNEIIKYIPLQQGLRLYSANKSDISSDVLLSIFHYNKD